MKTIEEITPWLHTHIVIMFDKHHELIDEFLKDLPDTDISMILRGSLTKSFLINYFYQIIRNTSPENRFDFASKVIGEMVNSLEMLGLEFIGEIEDGQKDQEN